MNEFFVVTFHVVFQGVYEWSSKALDWRTQTDFPDRMVNEIIAENYLADTASTVSYVHGCAEYLKPQATQINPQRS